MKTLLNAIITTIVCLATQISYAHVLNDNPPATCGAPEDLERIWRINNNDPKEKQEVTPGQYIALERTGTEVVEEGGVSNFILIGEGLGKLENPAVFLEGTCRQVKHEGKFYKTYVVEGEIIVNEGNGNIQHNWVRIWQHLIPLTQTDDMCQDHISGDLDDCRNAVQNQHHFIGVTALNYVKVKSEDSETASVDDESTLEVILDLGQGHAHGGN